MPLCCKVTFFMHKVYWHLFYRVVVFLESSQLKNICSENCKITIIMRAICLKINCKIRLTLEKKINKVIYKLINKGVLIYSSDMVNIIFYIKLLFIAYIMLNQEFSDYCLSIVLTFYVRKMLHANETSVMYIFIIKKYFTKNNVILVCLQKQ